MKFRLKCTILALFLLIPSLSFAQTTSLDLISITMDPSAPAPGQNIDISVESFSTDLTAASIIWTIDGKNFVQGIGKTNITIAAPALGKTMSVLAIIKTVEGREVRKVLSIKSGGVDLIPESAGYVPPFYEGRSQYVYQNSISVNAIPHLADDKGQDLDPKLLVYKWTKNDQVIQDQSGYGKQTLKVEEDLPVPQTIRIDVSTPDGKQKATNTITLHTNDPAVVFYQNDPLYGVLYNRALKDDITLLNQEINVRAFPYSFSLTPRVPLSYVWSVNDLERDDLSTKENIILRTTGDTTGTSKIAVRVTSENNILQGANSELNISFSANKNPNNFAF